MAFEFTGLDERGIISLEKKRRLTINQREAENSDLFDIAAGSQKFNEHKIVLPSSKPTINDNDTIRTTGTAESDDSIHGNLRNKIFEEMDQRYSWWLYELGMPPPRRVAEYMTLSAVCCSCPTF